MSCGFVATNDINALCGTAKFKLCSISFRKKLTTYPADKTLKLSQLVNPRIVKHKNQVLCFCDDYIEIESTVAEPEPIVEEQEILEDPVLEQEYPGLHDFEISDLKKDRDEIYEKEKISWINRCSTNENTIEAIKLGYSCDEEYCEERLEKEWPGFFMIDESTTFWQSSCPSLNGLKIEKRLSRQINGFKSKYGTYTRIVKLESHDKFDYENCEAIVIFNYLNKFDVIAAIDQLDQELYGEK